MHHFHWVTLHVTDMEKSLHFYEALLGMNVAEHIPGEGLDINMMGTENGVCIELIRINGETVAEPGHGVSIGLGVERVDELAARLKAAGIPVKGPLSPNPHLKFYFVADPDGYTIQLI